MDACTVIVAGKDATVDGSVILATNDDWPGYPAHLVHVKRKRHKPGDKFTLVRGKKIPQVAETFAYTYASCAYKTGTRDESWLYGLNENQVAVGMAGAYNFKELDVTGCEIEEDDLPWLILERAKTARQAIEIITGLIDKYGFNTASVDSDGSVTMAIADPNEAWWFEPIPGGVWIATKVPDNMVSFRPNCFGTHIIDLNDTDNVVASDGLIEYAVKQGWYEPGAPFDFSEVYCLPKDKSDGYHETDKINALRRWRMACLFSGKDLPEDELIYEVVPKRKVSIRDVMGVLRDYLEGTKYDLTKAPEAGKYGNPFYEAWGVSLSRSGTAVSQVIQLRNWLPNEIGGVMWVAFDTPATSVYTPWYAGISETPQSFQIGEAGKYDENSAWWNFQEVSNLCYRRFDQAAKKDVMPAWKGFEDKIFDEIKTTEERALALYKSKDRRAASGFLNKYSNTKGAEAKDLASQLKDKLKAKYLDNTVVETGIKR